MSEREINERRNWKAQTFPYDYYIPDETTACLYCLTEKQAEILRGIIEPLGWKTRWWTDGDVDIDQDQILAYKDDITRRLMNDCCGDSITIQYRYSTSGVLQRSTDGGTTWEDAPQDDTRVNSPQFPPVVADTGTDPKCAAATGAVQRIKEEVGNQLTDDMTRYDLGQLISDWVTTMIQTSNPLQALLTVITNQIFALVIATLRPALTDSVYDTLVCIFLCHVDTSGFVDDTNWQGIRSDITDQIGGIAGVFLEHLIYMLGNGGTTNLMRSGWVSSANCAECDPCDDLAHVFAFNDSHFPGVVSEVFPDEDGVYHLQAGGAGGDVNYINVQFAFDYHSDSNGICNTITEISYTGDQAGYKVNLRCHDLVDDPLSMCNALIQRRGTGNWTWSFTLNYPTPCT